MKTFNYSKCTCFCSINCNKKLYTRIKKSQERIYTLHTLEPRKAFSSPRSPRPNSDFPPKPRLTAFPTNTHTHIHTSTISPLSPPTHQPSHGYLSLTPRASLSSSFFFSSNPLLFFPPHTGRFAFLRPRRECLLARHNQGGDGRPGAEKTNSVARGYGNEKVEIDEGCGQGLVWWGSCGERSKGYGWVSLNVGRHKASLYCKCLSNK